MIFAKLFLIVLILLCIIPSCQGQNESSYSCGFDANYTANSQFNINLMKLLDLAPRNMGPLGFWSSTLGQDQDTVNVMASCRADQTVEVCYECVKLQSESVYTKCMYKKNGYVESEFCSVSYSKNSILNFSYWGGIETKLYGTLSEHESYRSIVVELLTKIEIQTGGDGLDLRVGIATISTKIVSFYAMVECMPFLSLEKCRSCLSYTSAYIFQLYEVYDRIERKTHYCSLRYDKFLFYNQTRLEELHVKQQTILLVLPSKRRQRTKIIVMISVSTCVIILLVALILVRRFMKRPTSSFTETLGGITTCYDFKQISEATNNFANRIGRGGFGAVYKGILPNGQDIAVKRLDIGTSRQGEREFTNEVLLVSRLQHCNLVKLLGFSTKGRERLLIYEFQCNGSLDKLLFDPTNQAILNWDARLKIILGVTRGLMYLHQDSRLRIVHRDIKASNILLDTNLNPKIADFGLARNFDANNESRISVTGAAGTPSYMAPEYLFSGHHYSVKSDIFSFGIVLLEIICGRKRCSREDDDLLKRLWENFENGTLEDLIDRGLMNSEPSCRTQALKCIHIGLLCVQEDFSLRPRMDVIFRYLENSHLISSLPVPVRSRRLSMSRLDQINIYSANARGSSSRNTMSISELHPR